ncbi:MAG: hypothetical protein N2589_01965 [bacterium]|nr:hypothetical protein [bacterium]MCX7916881.1 hypothetical protein [bacterium]MDW8163524.1 M99 family metallo-carboxypeptidase C-terminal domain-containing protein [Candidatus Omnitrophota bacterium]
MINEIGIGLILLSLIFLMFFLSYVLFIIKKKKGIISIFISLLFTFFVGYYFYIILYIKPVIKKFEKYAENEKVLIKPQLEKENKKNLEILLVFNINGNIVKVGLDDEIEIKNNTRFKITDVEGIDKDGLKVNIIGFIGNPKFNDGQDLGYYVSYKDMMKNKAKDEKNKRYEIEVKKENRKIGSVYIKFVE